MRDRLPAGLLPHVHRVGALHASDAIAVRPGRGRGGGGPGVSGVSGVVTIRRNGIAVKGSRWGSKGHRVSPLQARQRTALYFCTSGATAVGMGTDVRKVHRLLPGELTLTNEQTPLIGRAGTISNTIHLLPPGEGC